MLGNVSYRRAIEAIRAELEQHPNDLRLLQKLGELLQKSGDNKSAAATFLKVAENYGRDAYFLRAVALLKQVLKLDPTLIEARDHLARYYVMLELKAEAKAEYTILLADYSRLQRMADILRVMVALSAL